MNFLAEGLLTKSRRDRTGSATAVDFAAYSKLSSATAGAIETCTVFVLVILQNVGSDAFTGFNTERLA
jgi:hypothetical protein